MRKAEDPGANRQGSSSKYTPDPYRAIQGCAGIPPRMPCALAAIARVSSSAPKRNLAGMPVQVIYAMVARIECVDDEVAFVDDFKPPGLGIIPAGRPAGEFENIRDRLENWMHLKSQFAFCEEQ